MDRYCPQHSALPGKLTAREALRLYARLRGVVPAQVEGTVEALLQRLDLTQYADRCAAWPHLVRVSLTNLALMLASYPVAHSSSLASSGPMQNLSTVQSQCDAGVSRQSGFGGLWAGCICAAFMAAVG